MGTLQPPLMTQPSGFSEAAETTRRISVLEMDDLLGLNEPTNTPKTADPFMVRTAMLTHTLIAAPASAGGNIQQRDPLGCAASKAIVTCILPDLIYVVVLPPYVCSQTCL